MAQGQAGTEKAQAWIDEILRTGGRPAEYRQGIAESCRIPVEAVDALIARGPQQGTPLSAAQWEDVAQDRLAQDRRASAAVRRAYDHEEE